MDPSLQRAMRCEHGSAAIDAVRADDPGRYLEIIARIVPDAIRQLAGG